MPLSNAEDMASVTEINVSLIKQLAIKEQEEANVQHHVEYMYKRICNLECQNEALKLTVSTQQKLIAKLQIKLDLIQDLVNNGE